MTDEENPQDVEEESLSVFLPLDVGAAVPSDAQLETSELQVSSLASHRTPAMHVLSKSQVM